MSSSPRPSGKSQRPLQRKRSMSLVPSAPSQEAVINCPVCFSMIQDAYMTRCGHSFCHECIKQCLESRPKCPLCSSDLIDKDGKEQVFPNIMLNDFISRYRREKRNRSHGPEISSCILQLFAENKPMNVSDIQHALELLQSKKLELEANSSELQLTLLREFLEQSHKKKLGELSRLKDDLAFIEQDISFLNAAAATAADRAEDDWQLLPDARSNDGGDFSNRTVASSSGGAANLGANALLSSRRFRMQSHFACLEECYFSSRQMYRDEATAPTLPSEAGTSSSANSGSIVKSPHLVTPRGLDRFAESLSKFTRYSKLQPLSTLNYSSDLVNGTSIVSSIEFDKDNEYFAIAGVTKRIKMFEYATVIRNDVDMHYPINEMVCNSKISCISWNSYNKGMLACSDYEGTVTVWDAYRSQKLWTYQEHEKRCWSVDFNKVDTKLLASGSDDTKVKLWAINEEHSVASIEAKANVCCVRFNPDSKYHLALGSADHCVHYYDLRNCKTSLGVFKGHKKAVSYVKFLNSKELVSASTDSHLKLWRTDEPHCLRSFTGHVNEKNFVGLATDGDYIACGSENNALYVYYKGLSTQIQTWSFRNSKGHRDDGPVGPNENEFVSAVCWVYGTPVVVAANSQGTIKLLELV